MAVGGGVEELTTGLEVSRALGVPWFYSISQLGGAYPIIVALAQARSLWLGALDVKCQQPSSGAGGQGAGRCSAG